MTVKDLLDVMVPEKEIFIKPAGRRTYFDGTAGDVPDDLYDAVVLEIAPQVYRDESYNPIKNYYGAWGVWVESIPALDEKIDQFEAAAKVKKTVAQVLERSDLTIIPDELLVDDGEKLER